MSTASNPLSSMIGVKCPFAIKWKIDEKMLKVLRNCVKQQFLKTETFECSHIPGIKYHLSIYPNGDNGLVRGQTWIYFNVENENGEKIKAEINFMIESREYTRSKMFETHRKFRWGIGGCSNEDFFNLQEDYIIDGEFTIKCEGTFCVQESVSYREVYPENEIKWGAGDLGRRMWEGNNKDFTIRVNGKSIEIHKLVLSLCSPVFDRIFTNPYFKEAISNEMVIPDFTYEIVEAALELCYNRKSSTLTLEEEMGVLKFFDKYDIQDLKGLIEDSLITSVTTFNLCRIANCSIESNAIKLQTKCCDFLFECSIKKLLVNDYDKIHEFFATKFSKDDFYTVVRT